MQPAQFITRLTATDYKKKDIANKKRAIVPGNDHTFEIDANDIISGNKNPVDI